MAGKKPQKGRKPTAKQSKFVENYLQNGGNATKAAKDAGYSPKVAAEVGCENLRKSNIRERIEARMRDAEVTTNEIIGTLVSQMRGDFADILPEDEFFKKCRENGVSHLIKEVETTKHLIPGEDEDSCVTEVKRKIKIHDSQAAAKQLCNVFGLEKLPAPNPETMKKLDEAVEKFIEKAAKKGITVTPEQARSKLMPFIQTQTVQ
jgi:phage terminase small subunit